MKKKEIKNKNNNQTKTRLIPLFNSINKYKLNNKIFFKINN